MKLYECNFAPSPRRVRMFLAEKGVTMPFIQVDLLGAENLKPDFLAISPRGMVPTLELDDGTRIDECVAISRYIEELHPEPNLMGTDARSRAVIESRNRHMEIDVFLPASLVFRNTAPDFAQRGLPGIPEPVPAIAELADRGAACLHRFYVSLDEYLGQNRYVAGDRFTIADITALCSIDFAGWVKLGVPAKAKNVQRWYEEVNARPSAKA